MHIKIKRIAVLVVLADKLGRVSLIHRLLQRDALGDELAANIDIGRMRAHREGREHRALDQQVRIMAQDLAILAGTRLGFIGVDDEVMRAPVVHLRHEGPLHAGGEARTAAPTQAGGFHLVDDPVTAHLEQVLGAVPIAALECAFQARILPAVEVREDAVAIVKHAAKSGSGWRGSLSRFPPAWFRFR